MGSAAVGIVVVSNWSPPRLRMTTRTLSILLDTATSDLPSPSKSAAANE
ncbi:hypothetical protein [Nannocystis pusilla]